MNERNYDEKRKTKMDEMLLVMPGVKASKAFGYPAYKINGKVFAFVGSKGVAIKLPAARVKALLDGHVMKPFEAGEGNVWREWVSIQRETFDDYEQDAGLFEESVEFLLS
jgi:hypothetical protein